MDVIEAILNRYSVRDFSSQPVPKETVMKILEAATHSPSGITVNRGKSSLPQELLWKRYVRFIRNVRIMCQQGKANPVLRLDLLLFWREWQH